jgi:ribosomal protein S18 acetylase RimI-like enzyme
VIVRELRTVEWRAARELRLRALAEAPTAFLRTLAEERAYGDDVWQARAAPDVRRASFVAEAEGELVGSATGFVEGVEAALVAMWVAPEQRRRGVGAALVERVVEWAREGGAAGVTLEVNESLAPALALYERAGFVPTGGRRPLPTDPGHDAIELRLALR